LTKGKKAFTYPIYITEAGAGNYFEFQGGAIASLFEGCYLSNPDMDDKTVNVSINCEKYFLAVRGRGATFGFFRGTIPNLVE
jgi:hypothetical protein